MDDLKITIIQSNLHWENKEENKIMFSQKIDSITDKTDLIVLPEMFTTGFSMKPKQFAESMDGYTVEWMKEQAKKKNCIITLVKRSVPDSAFFSRLPAVVTASQIFY